jgi:VCBS repeat-containing protein
VRVRDSIQRTGRGLLRAGSSLALALALGLIAPVVAHAASITVDTTNDWVDGNTANLPSLSSNKGADGKVSFREAVLALQGESVAAQITLTNGTYVLEGPTTSVGAVMGGSLDIPVSVAIVGAGSTIRLNAAALAKDGLIEVDPNTGTAIQLTVSNATLADGWAKGPVGGGAISAGGGIPGSAVSLQNCILADNRSVAGSATAASGGALSIGGNVNLTLNACTFTGNSAEGVGGAVFVADSGTGRFDIDNCTFTDNISDGKGFSAGQGGAIYARAGSGKGYIDGSTFTGNIARSEGTAGPDRGGALFIGGQIYMRGNRIVNNTADVAPGAFGFLGTPDAEYNWWGTNSSPTTSTPAPVAGGIDADPQLKLTITPALALIDRGVAIGLTAKIAAATYDAPDNGLSVAFATAAAQGTVAPTSRVLVAGEALSTFTAGQSAGPVLVSATYDGVVATTTVGIKGEPVITASSAVTFTVGTTSSVGVSSKGYPVPTMALQGPLPSGLTFDFLGSTGASSSAGALRGTPATRTGGRYSVNVTAVNGVLPNASTPVTVTVVEAPLFSSAMATTVTVGSAASREITTTGFPAAALSVLDPLPAGLTFTSHGDGTASIAGTPADGEGGVVSVRVVANNGVSAPHQRTFTFTVLESPGFISDDWAGFVAGSPSSFAITADGYPTPTLSVIGAFPLGVSMTDLGGGSGELTGTPAPGTGGTYPFTLVAENTEGSIGQPFALYVDASPTADDDAASCAEDALSVLDALANDIDPDDDELGAELLSLPSHGAVTLSSSGIVTYTPSPDFHGTDTFTYRATADGLFTTLYSDPATVTITVTPVNDAPGFTPGGDVTVDEDSGAYSALWATDISAGPANESAQALTFDTTCSASPLFAAQPAVALDGTLSFTPAPNAHGSAEVTVTITDDDAAGGPALTHAQKVTITVTPVNDAPGFTPGSDVTVDEDSGAYSAAWATAISAGPANESAQALTFDTTCSASPLFAAQPAVALDGTLSFTPAPNAHGSAEVTVTITDDDAAGGPALTHAEKFTITVNSVNDAPTAADDAASVAEDVTLAVPAPGVLDNDDDLEGDTLTATSASDSAHGSVSLDADGSFTYEPDADWHGTDTFTYRAYDGAGYSDPATVTITVTPVNDAPGFTPGGDVTVDEDSGAYSALWATDISAGPANESAQALTFDTVCSAAALFANGPKVASDGTLSFTPADDANGSAEVTVTITDDDTAGGDGLAYAQSFAITVNAVNDAPLPGADEATVREDGTLTEAAPGVLGNDTDVESDGLAAHGGGDSAHGTVALATDGSFVYTPDPDWHGTDTFVYRAFDGTDYSGNATVTVTVTAVNDAPSFTPGDDVTVDEDSGAYSAPWATAISAGPPNESAQSLNFDTTCSAPELFADKPAIALDGTLTFTPAPDANGTAQVTVTVTDDDTAGGDALTHTETFTIVVTAVADTSQLTVTSGSKTLAAYGIAYTLSGALTDGTGPLAGEVVTVQSSTSTTGFVDTALVATTTADGSFSFAVTPRDRTYYRVSLAGLTGIRSSAVSDYVRVLPRAKVTPPVAPAMYAKKSAVVKGSLMPRHKSGTRPVRIYKWRYVSGRWKKYGYVNAKVSDSSAGSRYKATVTLPYAGKWRLRAYSVADANHASSWSAGYVSVKVLTRGQRAVNLAKSRVGRHYRKGAKGPRAFDASGFTQYIYKQMGVKLPRTARDQAKVGTAVSRARLKPGDLVFFYSPITHVGIYVGGGKMIHCGARAGDVEIRPLYKGMVTARRVVK